MHLGALPQRVLKWSASHPLLGIFLAAFSVRLLVVAIVAILPDGYFALDDSTYVEMARAVAADERGHWDTYTHGLYHSTFSFVFPMALLFEVFGPSEIVGQVFVVLLGAGVAALVTRVASEFLSRPLALVAGLIIVLLPSQVIWSSLTLKDPAVWLNLVLLALLVALGARSSGSRLLLMSVGTAVALVALAYLREHTTIVAAWALVPAMLASERRLRVIRVMVAAALAIVVLWAVGFGPGGLDFIRDAGSLAERRIANAEEAGSAFVAPEKPRSVGAPSVRDTAEQEGSLDEDLAHLPRGLAAMLFAPYPWQAAGSTTMMLAQLETIVWYPLLVLAAIGLVQARRYLRAMTFPIMVGGGMLLVYALTEGNVGTAYRHRGEFVWVVALLAVIGLKHAGPRLSKWMRDRRRSPNLQTP